MSRGIKRWLMAARREVSREIAAFASRGRLAGAMGSEGYNEGYRDALSDVLLALDGVEPDKWRQWRRERTVAALRSEEER